MPVGMLSRASSLVYGRSLGSSSAQLLAKALQIRKRNPTSRRRHDFAGSRVFIRRMKDSIGGSSRPPRSRREAPMTFVIGPLSDTPLVEDRRRG
jgi:hypothetical protein